MLSWGARRQLTFLSFLTFVVLVAGLAFYFTALKQAPTCVDSIQNQEELGVDCGGPCTKVCSTEVTNLITHWARYFKVQNGRYDVGALISNPNVGFGVRSLSYTFRLYDAKSVLLAEKRGVTYVNEKEQFILFEPSLDTGNRAPVRVLLEIGDYTWERTKGFVAKPKFTFENKQLVAEPTPRLSALLQSTELTTVQNIELTAAVFDDKGNVLGISSTRIAELPKMSSKEVIFTWPSPFETAPALSEIYPRVNAFPYRQTN